MGNNKPPVTTAIYPSSSSIENHTVKYEKLGFADRLGVAVRKSKAEDILKKWTNNATKAKTGQKKLTELFGRGKPCDIKILKACIKGTKVKLKPNEVKSLEALCDTVYKHRNNSSTKIETNALKKIFNSLPDNLKNAFLALSALLNK